MLEALTCIEATTRMATVVKILITMQCRYLHACRNGGRETKEIRVNEAYERLKKMRYIMYLRDRSELYYTFGISLIGRIIILGIDAQAWTNPACVRGISKLSLQ